MNQRIKPSLLFYGVGLVMVVTAIIIIVLNGLVTINQLNLQKRLIKVPGINTVVFDSPGDYVAYYEPEVEFEDEEYNTGDILLPDIRVGITKLRSEEPYPFEPSTEEGVDFIFTKTGNPVFTFKVQEQGALVFDIQYVNNDGPDIILNVTKDIIDDIYDSLMSSVRLGLVIIVLGIGLIIGTFVARLISIRRYHEDKKFKEPI